MTQTTELTKEEIAEAIAYWLSEQNGMYTHHKDVRIEIVEKTEGYGAAESKVQTVKATVQNLPKKEK